MGVCLSVPLSLSLYVCMCVRACACLSLLAFSSVQVTVRVCMLVRAPTYTDVFSNFKKRCSRSPTLTAAIILCFEALLQTTKVLPYIDHTLCLSLIILSHAMTECLLLISICILLTRFQSNCCRTTSSLLSF